MTFFLRRMTMVGGALFLLASIAFLIDQAATAAGVPATQALGAPLLQLLAGRSGVLGLARIALIFQIVVLAWRLPPAGRGPARLWWITLAIGAVTLLTLSMTSHAAAEPAAAIAVPVDWLHLAAAVAWLGGLIPFLFAIREARRGARPSMPLAILTPRFSWLTAPSVAILALTGIYNYLLHVQQLDLLAATTYGRALLVKLGLFGGLLLLGGLNLLVLSRRLRASGNRLARALGGSVRVEVGVVELAGADDGALLVGDAEAAVGRAVRDLFVEDQRHLAWGAGELGARGRLGRDQLGVREGRAHDPQAQRDREHEADRDQTFHCESPSIMH